MSSPIEVSQLIAAPADRLYAMISDVTRMGEWSPETRSCRWVRGATGPVVGARFTGENANGKKRWSITSVVVSADPGSVFAFEATAGPVRYARWTYRFEPQGADTLVTESVEDRRGRLLKSIGGMISGVDDRESHNRAGMAVTLSNLKVAAEG